MSTYLNITSEWLLLLGVIYGIYLTVYFYRKNKKPKESKNQIKMAAATLLLSFLIEYIGVSSGLWTYFPGNWPISVWLGYFGVGLAGYQVFKLIEEKSN